MVETSNEIRRELEITRERMGDTLAELERKLNPKYAVQNHPMAALGVAFGVGILLGSTKSNGTERAVRTQRQPGRAELDRSPATVMDGIMEGVRTAFMTVGTAKLSQLIETLTSSHTPGNGALTRNTTELRSPTGVSGGRW